MPRPTLFLVSLFLAAASLSLSAQNALKRSGKQLSYQITGEVSASSGDTPLWLTANRYGVSSLDHSNGYLRVGLTRAAEQDSSYHWRIGYGADVAVAYNFTSRAFIQQLYADFDYRLVRLTVGAKELPMALKNAELSSGSQTLGINARPVPAVRFELPRYWNITGRGNWAAIRGHISYGMMTDGRFARDYVGDYPMHYGQKVLLHTKAGYLRLGNAEKFPVTFEGGLEMATQFGGTVYNAGTWDGVSTAPIKMGQGLRDFIDATLGIGGDATDGSGYANATGNTLGSWLFRLNYHGADWSVSAYYDHFFEDHSQTFFEYGWRDGLFGIEAKLPQNPFIESVVYEYMKTTYQSGPVYHDQTEAIPDQISGVDNYYNHNLYAGWQHWGQAMGNPLYISPLYNHSQDLTFTANRFRAHHVGISGNPCKGLHYRLLYTHERSLGTYATPFEEARTTNSLLVEVAYAPDRIGKLRTEGWRVRAALGLDRGTLLGDNIGFQLTISKSGLLTK